MAASAPIPVHLELLVHSVACSVKLDFRINLVFLLLDNPGTTKVEKWKRWNFVIYYVGKTRFSILAEGNNTEVLINTANLEMAHDAAKEIHGFLYKYKLGEEQVTFSEEAILASKYASLYKEMKEKENKGKEEEKTQGPLASPPDA